jgi:hypothetical protein
MIGLFFWLMFGPKAKLPPAGNANVNGNVESNINAEPVGPIPPPSAERQAEAKDYPLGLKQVAATFAERYLSYSSDQPNKNLADLSPLMTLKMQAVARELVDAGSQTGSAPGFVGYSAKALNSELISSDAAKAEVLVSLQRTQYSGDNPGPKVFYQEMTLQFVKIGADWRVDLLEVK